MNELKNVMQQEFAMEDNYKAISEKIKEGIDMKRMKVKYVAIPVLVLATLVIVFVGMNQDLFFKQEEKIIVAQEEEKEEIILHINTLKHISMAKLDADIKTIQLEQLPEKFTFMNHITIPKGVKLEHSYIVYTKPNREAKEYTILHDYVFSYSNFEKEKNIIIAFSETQKPLRDYYINEEAKKSTICGTELEIYQYEEMYMTFFEKNGVKFDIETNNITQEELVDLLKSILK